MCAVHTACLWESELLDCHSNILLLFLLAFMNMGLILMAWSALGWGISTAFSSGTAAKVRWSWVRQKLGPADCPRMSAFLVSVNGSCCQHTCVALAVLVDPPSELGSCRQWKKKGRRRWVQPGSGQSLLGNVAAVCVCFYWTSNYLVMWFVFGTSGD